MSCEDPIFKKVKLENGTSKKHFKNGSTVANQYDLTWQNDFALNDISCKRSPNERYTGNFPISYLQFFYLF